LHQDGDHTEPISPFARSICRRSREWTCESEGAKTRVSAVAARLPRAICRAMLDAHSSTLLTHQIGISDLQDGTCLGKRNGVRSARQVQGAVRRWGVLRFPRSVSNGGRRSDVAPAWCDLHGTCIGKRNGVRSARQVQGAVRRRGVLRFPRSVSNGARDARAARVRAVAARACDPRTPKVQHCQNCQTSRTLALERKRPVKPTEVFKVFKVR
jgi:hypothetical protein